MRPRLRRRIRWRRWILGTVVAAIGVFAFLISRNAPCPAPVELAAGVESMQAMRYRCYGPPSVLKLERVEKPVLADDLALVKVAVAAVNPLDWHVVRGEPYIMRMGAGFGTPKEPRVGVDFSGTVVAVGKAVTRFKPGDEIFGTMRGAFGEYVRVRDTSAVALKPAGVSHEQAAAIPVAAVTALQALRDHGKLQAGDKVLVNGASGGVGTYAVQLAKAMGAEVTGVCSTRNVDMVAALGADRVIDYKNVDFTTRDERYDLILDNVANRRLRDLARVLAPGGIAVVVGGGGPDENPWFGALKAPIKIIAYNPFSDREFKFFVADVNQKDLDYLGGLIASGRMRSVIDRTYPLAQVPEAVAYIEEGRARGKVIVTVDEARTSP